MAQETPVWFITGCSTGFGRDLALAVLNRGWRAVVTARDLGLAREIAEGFAENAFALRLDVTDATEISAAVRSAEERFGAIDVLVNNAGYGYQAPVEEGEDAEIRAMFDVNVFGLAAVTRAVLPGMRARRRGCVVNISSVAGFVGFPGSGYYAATKHAVEGLSDSLAREVGPLGISVLCVEPGPFRTDFAGRSLRQRESRFPDYEDTVTSRMRTMKANSGQQAGDPVRAAEAIITAVQATPVPQHLVLGAMGLDVVAKTLRSTLDTIETWREAGAATDFPAER